MKTHVCLPLLLVLGASLGCTEGTPTRPQTAAATSASVAADDDRGGPVAPEADKAEAAKGNNAFALDLYGKLRLEEGNLFCSPESISTALAMTYAGARGETAREMAATLHFSLDAQRLHPAQGALLRDLRRGSRTHGYRLSIANSLWGEKGLLFETEFLALTNDNYAAGLQEVDFQSAAEEARRTINRWMDKHTESKIKDLLQPGNVTTLTRLVLTNAIYFKSDWYSKFKKEQTHDNPFFVSGRDKVTVPLMNQTATFPYWEGDGLQVLELPYKGKDLSMVVFLPKKIDGLADVEKMFTIGNLNGWLSQLHEQQVVVSIPRFKMTKRYSLARELAALGMRRAFSAADFSGMTREKVMIADVIHKAFVEVNEEGTEAAAATAVVANTPGPPPMIAVFRADHPFLFLIRDRRSGSILFLGRLVKPMALLS
jgi:serpin B